MQHSLGGLEAASKNQNNHMLLYSTARAQKSTDTVALETATWLGQQLLQLPLLQRHTHGRAASRTESGQ